MAGVLDLELCIHSTSCVHAALKFTPFHFILRIITLYYFLTALLLHYNSLFSSSPVYLTKLNFNSFLNSFGELSINNSDHYISIMNELIAE